MNIKKSLSVIAAVLLLTIMMPNLLFSQNVQVTKVLDGNLLQLQNGQIVRLSGIYVPSTVDSNKNLRRFSGEIMEFNEKYFVNRFFKMKYNRTLDDSTMLVCLYHEYALGDDEDMATVLLKNGYAACIDSSDLSQQYNYAAYQQEAQDSKTGIWSIVPPDYFKNHHSPAYYKVDDIKNAASLPEPENTDGKIQMQNRIYLRQPILKDPTLAGILSFMVPGIGQCYDEDFAGGLLYFLGTGFCYYQYINSIHEVNGEYKADVGYLLAGTAVHLLSIIEASKNARDYNEEVYFSLNKVKDNYYVSLRLPLKF